MNTNIDKSILLGYETKRKCGGCSEYITLESEYGDIVYDTKYFHEKCYREKLLTRKIRKLSEEEIEKKIAELKEEKFEHVWKTIVKNHLYKFLMDKYGVIMLPNSVYTKMEQIFSGEYKNIKSPVPPEDLLDMWQRYKFWSDDFYKKRNIVGASRINYDSAILVGQYPNYVDWREKSKIETEKAETFIQTPKIDMGFLAKMKQSNRVCESILDDEDDGD